MKIYWYFKNRNKGVSYVLIGGWAVIIHGFPRLTNDMDFLIDNSPENIAKIKTALQSVFHDESIEDIKPSDIADYSVVRVAKINFIRVYLFRVYYG